MQAITCACDCSGHPAAACPAGTLRSIGHRAQTAAAHAPADVIALDLGGTKLLGAVVDERLELRHELRRSVRGLTRRDALAATAEMAEALARLAPEAVAAGLAVPYPLDPHDPVLAAADEPRIDLRRLLRDATGLPSVVDNDARAALFAEVVAGEAGAVECAIGLTVGTDIGGAVAVDGRVRAGASGFAGSFHQLLVAADEGAPVQWGEWVSGSRLGADGLAAAAAGAGPLADAHRRGEEITGELVTRLALEGDAASRALLADAARRLARGLALVVLCLDPDVVVVAGGVSRAGRLLTDELQSELRRTLPLPVDTPIRIARFGERAGLVGAALLAARAGRSAALTGHARGERLS